MKKYHFNKLIRSNLPERMKQEGVKIFGRSLDEQEFAQKLKEKLVEEAIEVQETNSAETLIKELADVMEVMESIISLYKIDIEDIKKEQKIKRSTNGNFLSANFVEYIEVAEDNFKVIEYLENRDRPYKFSN